MFFLLQSFFSGKHKSLLSHHDNGLLFLQEKQLIFEFKK